MTDSEIIEGLKDGSKEAFHEVYAAYGRSLFAYLCRLTGRQEMAEEITQDTFVAVVRKVHFFRVSSGVALKTWIFRIATHRAIDVIRREKKRVVVPDLPESQHGNETENAEIQITRSEISEELQEALNSLSEAQKMIFLLRIEEEMSCWEISNVIGCSETAVKQSLYRTRNTLRRKLCQRINLIPASTPN